MTLTLESPQTTATLADLIRQLGSIPLERIPAHPAPGTAVEADLERQPAVERRLYELVDGTLVEKPMGYYESLAASLLVAALWNYLRGNDLGIVLIPDGPFRLAPGLVRLPDVSFVSWRHFPSRQLPPGGILGFAPDLAVEIVSPGNTEAEMQRKLREYFAAGSRLVWIAEPEIPRVRCYTSPETCEVLGEDGVLTGGDVLPGFELPIREWLDRAGKHRTE